MKTIASLSLLAGLALAVAGTQAAEQIPWVADYRTACGMAAEQHRLVLLHFYSDNCAPCVRLEQNVFSRADVGEAVAQNFLAVKVHVEKTPQLANRYSIRAWPTDVFVTPAGLELYRTVSPQDPAEYVAVLNRVAQQSASNVRRPTNLKQMAAAANSRVTLAANEAAVDMSAAAGRAEQQITTTAQQVEQRVQQGAAGVMQQSTNMIQQSANAAQQSAATAQRWGQQAGEAVQNYEQQAGAAYQQVRNQTGQAVQQAEKQTAAAADQWRTTAQQTSQQVGAAAQNLAAPWQQLAEQLPLNRRSAFAPQAAPAEPQATSPAASAAAAPPAAAPPLGAATPAATPVASNAPPLAGVQAAQSPIASVQPPQPTTNPWLAANPPASPSPSNAPPAPPPTSQSTENSERQLVPASQAPPVALDGFCPVTLIETMSRSPEDRSAWKKGNVKFGAIHRGRTYLFTSAEQQQKFLADPDAYSPAFSGYDPVRYAERGELVDGKRAYGLITPDKHIFLFADETALQRFRQAPTRYSTALQQSMAQGTGGTSYR